ncbi:ThrRS/AlaRS common domain-containing protein [Byssothecium circinans]|uniref:ThrRS/AlaRS common domain-containing protein n=1 Tax=Byssothecium circinans TaxID=147558 RepID=A0A6A5U8J3_9PLEO|nr:ThrRS/AlaRS common domain-containing protein [Byssothecium circinans]
MATPTKTEALYQKDSDLHTHTSPLTSLTPLSSLPSTAQALFKTPPGEPFILTTPSTIFHAQGGGQPSDTGTMTLKGNEQEGGTFVVHQVRKVEPTILHLGTFEPPDKRFGGAEGAEAEMQVVQRIDSEARLLHSRLHTGGHALGLAINLLKQEGVLPSDLRDGKASHYPNAASVEFSGLIPGDKKSAIQEKVDELVSRDLEVGILFWSEERAGEKCIGGIGGAAVSGEDVRVVDIGGLGCYPCGGTHVRRLGEVGRVVVRGVKRQRGVSRVGYDVLER